MNQAIVEDLVTASHILADQGVLDGLASLGESAVVLLRGHGNAVVGPSVRVAVYRAVYTEANAKLLLQAKLLGGPIKYLAPEEAAIMNAARAKVRPGHGSDRIWELLKSEAMGTSGKRRR